MLVKIDNDLWVNDEHVLAVARLHKEHCKGRTGITLAGNVFREVSVDANRVAELLNEAMAYGLNAPG